MKTQDKKIQLRFLVPNPNNPKKPLGKKYDKGLEASLKTFPGLARFVVRELQHKPGYFEIGDGNTRFSKFKATQPATFPVQCTVVSDITDDEWTTLILSYDRNRGEFDNSKVAEQAAAVRAKMIADEDKQLLETLTHADDAVLPVLDQPVEPEDDDENESITEATVPILFEVSPDARNEINALLKKHKTKAERSKGFIEVLAQFGTHVSDDFLVEMAIRTATARSGQ